MILTATLYGKAQPQGSKRAVLGRHGKALLIDASPNARPWRQALSAEMALCRPERPWEGAVGVHVRHAVPRPQSHYGTGRNAGKLKPNAPAVPVSGIDLDKLARAVGDAGNGIWWRDDRQITGWRLVRSYSEDGSEYVFVKAWGVMG